MPSTYTGLGIDKMATGENAGTWGTATNTNLEILEQISGGYLSQALNTTGATTLAVADGTSGDTNQVAHRCINFTAALAGNVTVTIPLDVQQLYVIKNSTTNAFSVEFKYVSGSGSSVTWASGDRGTKIVYATANDATNPDIIDATTDYVTATSTTTLSNKTLTAPKFADGGFIADAGGDETLVFGEVSTPVNELKITNAATGAGPILSSVSTSATDTNIDINITPAGTGDVVLNADTVKVGDAAAAATLTSNGAGTLTVTTGGTTDLVLSTNSGTNSGTFTITDGVNGNITLTPDGTGEVQATDAADATAAVKIAGKETIWIPALAMFGTTTNGADAQAVETTALRPELKVMDFDPSTRENAQFSIAMPKSWNLGTVTYQVFWSPGNTNTDNCIFGLEGVSCTEGDTADVAFGTAIEVTDAGIGTIEDVQMTAESSAMTIAGSPADNDQTFFQLYRDAADGSDTFTGDARVLGIKLFYTTDAANDA